MKKLSRNLILAAAAGLALSSTAQAQRQIVSTVAGTFVDISATGTAIANVGDDTTHTITTTIGNAVFPAGNVVVCSNGFMSRGTSASAPFTNATIPATGNPAGLATGTMGYLCPFWDDLDGRPNPNTVIYWQQDVANNVLIVMWKNMGHFVANATQNITFEVKVFGSPAPGGPYVQFLYQDTQFTDTPTVYGADDGLSATIGIVADTNSGSNNVLWSYNSTSPGAHANDVLSVIDIPATPGSCCLNTGGCTDGITQFACVSGGGVYNGDNSLCVNQNCAHAGACCIPSTLTCISRTSAACTSAGGAYRGDDIPCPTDCPFPGRCCKNDGTCVQSLQAACTAMGGVYAGDSTLCNGTCPHPGACCIPATLTCVFQTQAACTAASGNYQGDDITCANANCPTPGACCTSANFSCSQTTSAACTTAGGVYRGDSTTCASAGCPQGPYSINCNAQGTFTDISGTGTPITTGDDSSVAFTSSVTNALLTNANLFASTNGMISDVAYATFTNAALPVTSAGLTFALYPNWDDLYIDTTLVPPGALVHQALVENSVNVEVIEWVGARTFAAQTGTPRGNFEVKIWDVGGPALVQFLYQDMSWDWNGNSSTVGVQFGANSAVQKQFLNSNTVPTPPLPIPNNSVCNIVANVACYANCDGGTTQPCLNVNDFSCFLNQFAAGTTYANCDNSTTPPVLNVNDFSCFLNKFAAGCSAC